MKSIHLIFLLLAGVGLAGCQHDPAGNNPDAHAAGDTLFPVPEHDSTGHTAHAQHVQELGSFGPQSEAFYDSVHQISHRPHGGRSLLDPQWKTFGWHPFYLGTAYKSYNFRLLWGIAYFSYETDPATGGYQSVHNWRTTAMADSAQKYGTRVFLAVNNFGPANNQKFLSNKAAWQVMADSLKILLKARNADGVNLDFEQVPASQRQNFSDFLNFLSRELKQANKNWIVSLALYTVDWARVFDIPAIDKSIDLYTLMGYDYYYAGSKSTGPVAPLRSGSGLAPYNLEKSVDYYLGQGIEKEKFILGLPYYGRQWKVGNPQIPTASDGYVSSPGVGSIMRDYEVSKAPLDTLPAVRTLNYQKNGQDIQLWYNDTTALGMKYDFAKSKGLAGIAIWSLGLDNGTLDYWDLMENKFRKR